MALFLKRYLTSLGIIVLAMIAYRLTVVPWIEPSNRVQYAIPNVTSISTGDRWWEPIFGSDDWQAKQPTVVHNSRGVLLAQTWEQVDQRTWKLTPLTIVLTQTEPIDSESDNSDEEGEAWVINAAEGATIHFDQPLELNSGSVPSIQRGQLEGEIIIRRLNLARPDEPTMLLRTRNLSIDRRQIWTQEEVHATSEDMLIRGRMLRIHLLGDILSHQSNPIDTMSDARSGPVEEIELMHLAEFKLRLQPGGIWAGVDPAMLQLTQPVHELPAHLEARCGGRFSLNFSKAFAILNGGVQLSHFLGNHPPDEFQCHRIQVRFQADEYSPTVSPSNEDAGPARHDLLEGLAVREFEAFGIDSLEDLVGEMWVEGRSRIANATMRAKRIRYDFRNQRVELAGKLNQPGATASVAELNYRGFQFRSPTIEYQAAKKSSEGEPRHLGWMVAQGTGEASTPADSPMGEVHVRWKDRFQWAPADQPGQQWIEIAGQTLVESKQRGFVTADRLQLWLAEATASQQAAERSLPTRLVSDGPTRIGMGNHQIEIESMDINFVYPERAGSTSDSDLELSDSSGNPMWQFLTQPETRDGSDLGPTHSAGQRAIRLLGKSLTASIAIGERSWIDAMTMQGPLLFESSNSQTSMPIKVTGDVLVMATSPDQKVDLEIQGNPAKVNLGDGAIEGPSIRFNERQNHIWMDQPGHFTISSMRLNQSEPDNTMQWAMPLRCSWDGRMLFDGITLRLDGGIRIHGALQRRDDLWLMEGLCQKLDVHFAQSMNWQFLNAAHQSDRANLPVPSASSDGVAQVSHLALRDDVDLRVARRDSFGQRVSLQRLQVPIFTIYVPQKKIVASGPGQGLAKFFAGRSLGPLAGTNEKRENRLQCVHLAFRDSLTGLLGASEIVADGDVRIVASPISDWDDPFDPSQISRFLPGQMSITSDQVKLVDTSSFNAVQAQVPSATGPLGDAVWEVQATGNVVFEGCADTGDFSGSAYQVSFVQMKDLLTLRGDGRTKAVLRRIPPANSTTKSSTNFPTIIQVPVASLNVKTMAVEAPQGGLDLQVDFHNPTGNINSGNPGKASEEGPAKTVQPPNPRDGIKNMLRGY